jgi:DNA polymerase III alpha subunit (gram-positive type)
VLFGVFDTETTGLPLHRDARLAAQPRIIEFGGIITDGTNVLHTVEFICNPGMQIEQIITDITGLTNDDLKDREPFAAFTGIVKGYFSEVDAIISHNLSFDKSMVDFDLRRIKMALADVGWRDQLEICTVEQTFLGYGKRMRLQDLYSLLVGPYTQKHRAVDDTHRLHEICQRIGVYDALTSMEDQ